jgi:hypothetical protein
MDYRNKSYTLKVLEIKVQNVIHKITEGETAVSIKESVTSLQSVLTALYHLLQNHSM